MEMVKEKMERYKVLAEIYLHDDKRIFIKDINGDWYFCDIILVGEDNLMVDCFAPEQRIGKQTIPWAKILFIDEYKEDIGK